MEESQLLEEARKVLAKNDRGKWTVPHENLYPHQWLWDSCFIAIGLRQLDIDRAQTEIKSLLRGQWSTGMLAHMIFSGSPQRLSQKLQEGWINPNSPNGVKTSGFTQPPMINEAVWLIGQKLNLPERRTWFKAMLPHLTANHEWLYDERDGGNGLFFIIHPYESGLDNSPSSIIEIHDHYWPWWLKILDKTGLVNIANLVRRDLKYVDAKQRMNNAEAIAYFALAWRLQRQDFDIKKILRRPKFALEELTFNCIAIRANERLREIAKVAGVSLPDKLMKNFARSKVALEALWEEDTGFYSSRSIIDRRLIGQPTISTLLPLYSGAISAGRAEQLVSLLRKKKMFATKWPVPSVPIRSGFFNPIKYWQGPTWVNTNWLIIDGLKQYGYTDEAEHLKERTLKMVAMGGFVDYYNPLNGRAVGAQGFSWTAALAIDLLKS